MTTLTLPSRRDESWRWADPEAIAAAAQLPWSDARVDAAEHWLDLPGARLVFVDGVLDAERSILDRVTIEALEASAHALGQHATGPGWALRVAADGVESPVQVVHLASGGANHVPAAIELAAGAAATVIETFIGSGWSNRATRIMLGDGARLMRSVRMLQAGGFVSLREEAEIGAGASLIATFLGAGEAGTRVDGAVTVTGQGGFAEFGGALLTRDDQRQECAVSVRHDSVGGSSKQVWRAVAADRSTASLAARVEVARDAQQTDGEQSLRGLLLQRTATINLKPELEIFADDVKCAHGATVGELDRNALFYLASRGVPLPEAKALVRSALASASGTPRLAR